MQVMPCSRLRGNDKGNKVPEMGGFRGPIPAYAGMTRDRVRETTKDSVWERQVR